MRTLLLILAFASVNVAAVAGSRAVAIEASEATPPLDEQEISAVRLSSSAKGVLVNWIISDTTGTSRYELMRSIDGISWTTIYTLAADRALVLLDESFTDPIPVEGFNAYRVVALKQDGRRTYSTIERIYYFPFAANAIFPNPVGLNQPFYLLLDIPLTSELDVEILDDKGNRVDWFKKQPTGQREQYQFVHHARSAGNYAVTVYVDDLPVQSFPLQVR